MRNRLRLDISEELNSYIPLRIDHMPVVEVHIVPSQDAPTNTGKPRVPPIGPALANAVLAARR